MIYKYFITIYLLERARISWESKNPKTKSSGPAPAAPDQF